MFLDVSQMRSARDRVERVYERSALGWTNEDFEVAAPVRLVFDIFKDKDEYHLIGSTATRLRLNCGRCLESLEIPVALEFDLLYVPDRLNRGEGEVAIGPDDLSTAYYRDGIIDLGQLLKEQIYLALPMKPLCAETCRGLCPECGTNLNTSTCSCAPRWSDPRLEALKTMLGPGRED
jgi:uncharacterized protein